MAKRFHFPLETLLRVRRLHEEEAKRKVAAQSAAIAQLDRLNVEMRQAIDAEQRALRDSQQAATIRPAELSRGRAWIGHLRNTIAQRLSQRAEMAEKLETLQRELREARKQTRIIEKLRERRWDEYKRARLRREQAESDELAQQLHAMSATDVTAHQRSSRSQVMRDGAFIAPRQDVSDPTPGEADKE